MEEGDRRRGSGKRGMLQKKVRRNCVDGWREEGMLRQRLKRSAHDHS